MAGSEAPQQSPWGGVRKAWSSVSASQGTSSNPSSGSASAFPPLSNQSRSPVRGPSSQWRQYGSSSSSFNPYPTRTQELAERAQFNAHRRRAQLNRNDPGVATLRRYEHSDEDDLSERLSVNSDDGDAGQVSSRGATMSSIVFRDLTASGSSRSATPGQSNLSPGLAMFAQSSFGGEPLRILSHMDNELRAAHLGPRIYKRHNQKYVQAKRRGKKSIVPASELIAGRQAPALLAPTESRELASSLSDSSDSASLSQLVQQYIREKARASTAGRTLSESSNSSSQVNLANQICRLIEEKLADPSSWSGSISPITPNLVFAASALDLSSLLPDLLPVIRRSVLRGIMNLIRSLQDTTPQLVARTLAHLLALKGLKPSSAVGLGDASLQIAVVDIYIGILTLISKANNSRHLVQDVLQQMTTLNRTSSVEPLRSLTSDLIGFCGQQLAGNPTILDETQDRSLVAASQVLDCLYSLNSQRPAAVRLPAHAFYCTVLDLCPFLEHYIHYAASFIKQDADVTANLAQFNVCRHSFLLSLGAKARVLQLENELRLSSTTNSMSVRRLAFAAGPGSRGQLLVLPDCIKLTITRSHCREQSQNVLLQLLNHCETVTSYDDLVAPLRVDFDGELAVDGGGPTREWFATVIASHRPASLVSHGWFVQSSSQTAVDEARFLGLLLAFAALHSTKVALGFDLAPIAFKLAMSADIDNVCLSCVDLEGIDPPLARSLATILEWTPEQAEQMDSNPEQQFDSTFSLTWCTSVQDGDGGVQVVDLVPGGRHRSVRLSERQDFVSKLIWQVLVGSVRNQVHAFCAAWQAVMPHYDVTTRSETSTEVICRGGLAMELFDPSEIADTVCSVPAERGAATHALQPLDVTDLQNATELVLGPSTVDTSAHIMSSFWNFWTRLEPVEQRKLLAFITGSQDVPMTGARGIGLRIHLVQAHNLEIACHHEDGSWPLPWSSTCTSTLFLPAYPSSALMEKKLLVAIEHYRGFGLR